MTLPCAGPFGLFFFLDEDVAGPNDQSVPDFGEACAVESKNGIYSHPWTGEVIEVPDAGCVRFWIELEFGKWLGCS
jgi:hypothetical protein